jgi:hypothetical protein
MPSFLYTRHVHVFRDKKPNCPWRRPGSSRSRLHHPYPFTVWVLRYATLGITAVTISKHISYSRCTCISQTSCLAIRRMHTYTIVPSSKWAHGYVSNLLDAAMFVPLHNDHAEQSFSRDNETSLISYILPVKHTLVLFDQPTTSRPRGPADVTLSKFIPFLSTLGAILLGQEVLVLSSSKLASVFGVGILRPPASRPSGVVHPLNIQKTDPPIIS